MDFAAASDSAIAVLQSATTGLGVPILVLVAILAGVGLAKRFIRKAG
jgi:hypothetical protein